MVFSLVSSSVLPSRWNGSISKLPAREGFVLGACRKGLGLLILLVVAGSGCYWARYAELTATHVELLEQHAKDARDAALRAPRPITNSDIRRLRYPAERAAHFQALAVRRYPDRASALALGELVTAYTALVDSLDASRSERSPKKKADLEARIVRLANRALAEVTSVRDALAKEEAGG